MESISAQGPDPHCRCTVLASEGRGPWVLPAANPEEAAQGSSLLPWGNGSWSKGAPDPGCRARGSHLGTSRTDGTLAPLEVSSSGHDARSEGTRVFLLSPLSRASAPPGVFMSCHKPVPLDSATLPRQPRFPFRTPDPRRPISFRTGKEHNPLRYGIWLCPQTQHPGQRPSNLHPCRNSPLTSDLWSSGR